MFMASVLAAMCKQRYSMKPQDEIRDDTTRQRPNAPLCLCTTTWQHVAAVAVKHWALLVKQ